ncbi:AhpC/TSA family protein [Lichenihabitans sp. PAMC28606]|uniref:peroxiredoxin-like family protein n=1 Tax=Lichenihabitans sp. PAMC28606 TaxID=2880932 RepID=UPI001D0B85EB|nr:peroxiredoxin-like family protein [Lichenihabitans sp. PAMC28606]UDL93105.1 AhpC/TSA family protein [Lichenihabitans sp. PAMC28606]
MPLLMELAERRRDAKPGYIDRIAQAAQRLEAAGIPQGIKGFGSVAPDFALPMLQGGSVVLSTLLRAGPVVLSFYRGEWCPFCQAELDALLIAQPAMERLGAALLLISPERPSQQLALRVARLGARAHLIEDAALGVALTYGLVYRVPDVLRDFYLQSNPALSRELEERAWLLPLPADFVIGQSGIVELSYVDADFTRRLDPDLIVETLERVVASM